MGPRNGVIDAEVSNTALIEVVIEYLDKKYGTNKYYLVTMGCDRGFGRDLSKYCVKHHIRFVHIDAFLLGQPKDSNGNVIPFGTQQDCANIFKSRHAALLELGKEFFIKVIDTPTQLDDLITRVKLTYKPYYVYSGSNECLEYRGDPNSEIKEQDV